MRRRQLKWLWQRFNRLAAMQITREQLLMKLGAARAKAPIGWRLIDITVDPALSQRFCPRAQPEPGCARSGDDEGRYLLRTNLTEGDPATLWQYYIQLVAVEEAFKTLQYEGGSVKFKISHPVGLLFEARKQSRGELAIGRETIAPQPCIRWIFSGSETMMQPCASGGEAPG